MNPQVKIKTKQDQFFIDRFMACPLLTILEWNDLMAIVERIYYYGDVTIERQYACMSILDPDNNNNVVLFLESAIEQRTIDAVYSVCLQFAEWYNERYS